MWTNEGTAEQPSYGSGSPFLAAAPVHSAQPMPYAPAGPPANLPAPVAAAAPPAPRLVSGASDVPAMLADQIELARFLADANLLPERLRKQPANVLLVMHRAMALDVPLSVAIEHMHVIDGQVGQSAELLRGLIHKAGHMLRWGVVNETEANAELFLRHDPRHPRTERFTISDAQRMKLTGKDNWAKDPASMLVARVTTRLVSRHCPEIALAIGNLSKLDFEDLDAGGTATERADTGPGGPASSPGAADEVQRAAGGIQHDARLAQTVDQLTVLGTRAREAKLMNVPVTSGGRQVPLHEVLLGRLAELRQAEAGAGGTSAQVKPDKAEKPEYRRASQRTKHDPSPGSGEPDPQAESDGAAADGQ